MLRSFFSKINGYIIQFLKNSHVIPITLGGLFFLISEFTRVVLIVASQEETTFMRFIYIFFFGFLYDLTIVIWFLIPLLLYFTWIPTSWHNSKYHRKITGILFFIAILVLLSVPFIEYFFWIEYKARLNFVAMDYLVYPLEVIGFIWESYPVIPILFGIIILITGLLYLFKRLGWIQAFLEGAPYQKHSRYRKTLIIVLTLCSSFFIAFFVRMPISFSNIQQELSHNGAFSLSKTVYFCLHNYHYSYLTLPQDQIISRIKELTHSECKHYVPNSSEFLDLQYKVEKKGPEYYPNVILVVMESFDAKYMECFGNTQNVTPNFNRLAKESLFFDHFYASAIRTVGGLESITTSRPTLAKFSLLKRDYNVGITTLATVFNQKGYQSTFIYPGDSHFDNQKTFFTNNGFKVLDIKDLLPTTNHFPSLDDLSKIIRDLPANSSDAKIKQTLKNVLPHPQIFKTTWGVCDEVLLDWVIQDADTHTANHQPFFSMAMTCSNHIPFDVPPNKVSLPNKTPAGAMQYADYAVGQFLQKASTKSWYNNTIFVFVADHCTHKSDAESDMSPCNFHIPFMIYSPNPKLVKPQVISTLGCQTDLAPTLFSLLNWSYLTEFLGQDLLTIKPQQGRALLATFKTLGLYQNNYVTNLIPIMDQENGYNILKVNPDQTTTIIKKITPKIRQQLYDNKVYYQIAEELYAQCLLSEKKKKAKFHLFFDFDKKKIPEDDHLEE